MEEVAGVLWRANLQDEESNGDGDDRIGERDDPCRITLAWVGLAARTSSRGTAAAFIVAAPCGLPQR
jgi:hypothetical protein